MDKSQAIPGTDVLAKLYDDGTIRFYSNGKLLFTARVLDSQNHAFPPLNVMELAVSAYYQGRSAGVADGMVMRSNQFRDLLLMSQSD